MSRADKNADNLRARAEQALRNLQKATPGALMQGFELETIFQELQIHQIELEMQNDELRIVNEQLEMQQLKFVSIYDLAPVAYFILNDAGSIKEVNSAGYSYLQAGGKAAVLGKFLQRFITQEHKDDFYRFLTHIRNSGQRRSIQLKMSSASGHKFDAQLEGIAVQGAHSAPVQYYIAVVDISESISAKQHLSETSERLELALKASGASIWQLDLATMKFESEELNKFQIEGRVFKQTYASFLELLHPDDKEAVDQHFRMAINQQREVDILCRVITDPGKCNYYSLNGHTVTGNAGKKCFVGIMMDVSEREKMEAEALRLKQDQQKNMTLAMIDGQENARKRISYALHDSVSQLLYGIKMKLGILPVQTTGHETFDDIGEMLNLAIKETRNISFELAPSILTDFGLPTALDELAKRFSMPHMRIRTRVNGLTSRLDPSLETAIFRIVQELINNCMKHSGARLITVEIKLSGMISIVAKDNGKGFTQPADGSHPAGAGLSSIRNRVILYNGTMHIETAPGNGTTVSVKLPFDA